MTKEDYQIDIEHVEAQFEDELSGIDVHVTEREIGNGPQFAVEAYREDESTQLWESQWYNHDEFEAFCAGMKGVATLFRKAERERDD